ncbi:hypothetical protein PVAND_007755 [Polypedilum vanderplanki]|uniref:Uncharacterized protein n=1 Tax=Polypedilum vanderplanki TaxID=319348 RepID=A0A9J6C7C1_POLVA|nr:hypothetical protein PVAND_007755 [Polypedilum vanderplanki]
MSSGMNSGKDDTNHKLLSLGKSVSCDNVKANSCIELADIRKLDSLLNQCESISCDNLLLLDDIYNYDMCHANRRKYASTSAINKILPKNSIRRRAHKKVLGIRESDTKIIKFLDDKRNHDVGVSYEKLTNCCDLNNDNVVVVVDVEHGEGNVEGVMIVDDERQKQHQIVYEEDIIDKNGSSDDATITIDMFNLEQQSSSSPQMCPRSSINCCDKTIQTSYIDLINPPPLNNECICQKSHMMQKKLGPEKDKRKKCTCRDYRNVNNATICETSLSTVQHSQSKRSHQPKKSVLAKKEKSDDKSQSNKYNRLMKQKNTIIDDDDCVSGSIGGEKNGTKSLGGGLNDECHESRVININQSVEIIPISTANLNIYSQPATPRLGTSTSLHHDADKSDTHSQRSQKSRRSKFSPSFISRKLTSRLNSSELEDGAGGAKESLLGRAKSAEKKLPEPVETVCISKIQ